MASNIVSGASDSGSGSDNTTVRGSVFSNLSAIMLPVPPNQPQSADSPSAASDPDAGFCSASSDISDDCQPQSPTTDVSQNSVDCPQFTAITLPSCKNKRKTCEPTRVPLKKRKSRFVTEPTYISDESVDASTVPQAPLQQWTTATTTTDTKSPAECPTSNSEWRPWDSARHPAVTTQHRANVQAHLLLEPATVSAPSSADQPQEQPLALIKRSEPSCNQSSTQHSFVLQLTTDHHHQHTSMPSSAFVSVSPADLRLPTCMESPAAAEPASLDLSKSRAAIELLSALQTQLQQQQPDCDDVEAEDDAAEPDTAGGPAASAGTGAGANGQQHRNYKNMTRERRIEANARERTRVHTISAAFDTLRKSVPSYAQSQKLSKLSVLRVACSYILTLSRMMGEDYSADQSEPAVNECVDEVTKTIQTEGKVRKKKDE